MREWGAWYAGMHDMHACMRCNKSQANGLVQSNGVTSLKPHGKNPQGNAKDIHWKEPGSTKILRVIYPSSDNTGLSKYSLSSIILKRTHLSVISRINRVRLLGPKQPPHHVLIKAKDGVKVLRFLASRALRLKATPLLKWLDQCYHPQGGLHQVNDLKPSLVRNTPSKPILLPFSYLKFAPIRV